MRRQSMEFVFHIHGFYTVLVSVIGYSQLSRYSSVSSVAAIQIRILLTVELIQSIFHVTFREKGMSCPFSLLSINPFQPGTLYNNQPLTTKMWYIRCCMKHITRGTSYVAPTLQVYVAER